MNLRKLIIRKSAGALGLLLTLSLILVSAPALAAAPPEGSHFFYGTLTIDGADAPVDTVITASVAGLEFTYTTGVEGQYGYGTATFYIPPEGLEDGDLITFSIGGVTADLYDVDAGKTLESYPFDATMGMTNLNLSVGEVSLMPVAAFSASPLSGDEPLTVVFTDESQNMINNPTWSWDFGDGGTSTEASPTHQYLEAGSYTVTLTVTTDDGTDGEVKVDYIVVLAEGGFDPYTYDENEDGKISYDEAVNAVNDYYAGGAGPTKADVLAVIKLYFS